MTITKSILDDQLGVESHLHNLYFWVINQFHPFFAVKHSSSDEHQGKDHVLENHHQETIFVAALGRLGAGRCVNGQEGWEEGEDGWGGNRYGQDGSQDVDQGEHNLIPL